MSTSGVPRYQDVSDVIEAIVYTEGRRYPIPGLDHDDIAQEIRLECIRVLNHYDSSRIGPSPYKFLQVCIRNFLYNMRRGIYVPNNPPCSRCPLWDRYAKRCLIDEIGCSKIVQYREGMATKAAIRNPSSLEIDMSNDATSTNEDAILLDESIKSILPAHFQSHYENMKNGRSNAVPARIKRQIRVIIKEFLEDA